MRAMAAVQGWGKCGRRPVPEGAGGSGSWMSRNRRSVVGNRRQRSMRAATCVLVVMDAGTRLASNSVPDGGAWAAMPVTTRAISRWVHSSWVCSYGVIWAPHPPTA